MYKLVLLLAPVLLTIVLVHSYDGGAGLAGGSQWDYGQTYPLNTYQNAVSKLNQNYYQNRIGGLLNGYQNPNRWSFLLPLALALLLAFNATRIATTG